MCRYAGCGGRSGRRRASRRCESTGRQRWVYAKATTGIVSAVTDGIAHSKDPHEEVDQAYREGDLGPHWGKREERRGRYGASDADVDDHAKHRVERSSESLQDPGGLHRAKRCQRRQTGWDTDQRLHLHRVLRPAHLRDEDEEPEVSWSVFPIRKTENILSHKMPCIYHVIVRSDHLTSISFLPAYAKTYTGPDR